MGDVATYYATQSKLCRRFLILPLSAATPSFSVAVLAFRNKNKALGKLADAAKEAESRSECMTKPTMVDLARRLEKKATPMAPEAHQMAGRSVSRRPMSITLCN